jgi:hypothetical protein
MLPMDRCKNNKPKNNRHWRYYRSNNRLDNRLDNRMNIPIKSTVKNINLDCVKPERAGIIIYTVIDGAFYMGLCVDAKSHDLTDAGGRVNYETDHNVIQGAIREFEEETLGIFDPIEFDDIKDCPVIYDDQNLIIFMHINIDPNLVSKVFHESYLQTPKRRNYPEVCGVTWLTWEEFQYCLHHNGILYSRVQRFLKRVGDFSYLL